MADSESWKSSPMRMKVIAQIDDAIKNAGNPTSKNPMEMESHVFQKAKSKEEYLSYVARLIIHVREMNPNKKQGGQAMSQQGGMQPGGVPMQDPINALQNLTRQEGPLTYISGSGSQLGQALAGQVPNQNQMTMGGMNMGPNQGMGPGSGPMTGMMSGGPQGQQMNPQQFSMMIGNRPRMPDMMNPAMSNAMQLQHFQTLKQQGQQPGGMQRPGKPQGMNDNLLMAGQGQGGQGPYGPLPPGQPQGVRQGGPGQFMTPSPNNPMQISPSPNQGMQMGVGVSQQSPISYIPSPSGMLSSPVGSSVNQPVRTPGSVNVPSPGSAINTPGMVNPGASPATRVVHEDQAYLEKVKQLSKYIEPLRRMIVRMDKDEDKKKEIGKMKSLMDILSNPTKRLNMEILLKCEQVLEKMELVVKPAPTSVEQAVGLPCPPVVQGQSQNICQPLLEALTTNIKSPLINHTLQRTFGPAVAALHGIPTRCVSPPPKKQKKSEDESLSTDIPDVLQGEIARLDQRFKVNLDPLQHSGARTIHLICQLDDRNLPCVPPITVTVPDSYPQQPPQCDTSSDEYDSTPFLKSIQRALSSRLMRMPDKFSITSLLDTWEMSVRQACAPSALVTSTTL